MKTPLLSIKNLVAGYRGRPVITGLHLEIAEGERVALIGPNGCGKSTLLRAVVAEIVEDSGDIRHRGDEIAAFTTDRVIRHGVGYLRQNRNIFPGLSVEANLELAAWGDGINRESVMAAFPVLSGRESVRAGLLSGGERQALAVAMALMRPVSLLLLDEPLAGLSPKSATALLQGLNTIQNQRSLGFIMVEHRLKLIRSSVDRVIIMVHGEIREDTQDLTILEDQGRLEKHYLL
jgi:ABC-type branched-subunit amino acid transport system ATPase component